MRIAAMRELELLEVEPGFLLVFDPDKRAGPDGIDQLAVKPSHVIREASTVLPLLDPFSLRVNARGERGGREADGIRDQSLNINEVFLEIFPFVRHDVGRI
jgi:hypothetical protein